MSNECIFCKIARQKQEFLTSSSKSQTKGDISSKIIYENDNFFSISDANPVVEGHTLVISKKHFENVLDMPNTLGPELLDCIKNTGIKVMEEKKADGFNLVVNTFEAAGQIVNHVHFHILPRKKDDGVKMVV